MREIMQQRPQVQVPCDRLRDLQESLVPLDQQIGAGNQLTFHGMALKFPLIVEPAYARSPSKSSGRFHLETGPSDFPVDDALSSSCATGYLACRHRHSILDYLDYMGLR